VITKCKSKEQKLRQLINEQQQSTMSYDVAGTHIRSEVTEAIDSECMEIPQVKVGNAIVRFKYRPDLHSIGIQTMPEQSNE